MCSLVVHLRLFFRHKKKRPLERRLRLNQIIQIKLMHKQLSMEHWVNYEVFTWQWWIGVACVVIPLLLMWKLVDKHRLLEIIAFGFMLNIGSFRKYCGYYQPIHVIIFIGQPVGGMAMDTLDIFNEFAKLSPFHKEQLYNMIYPVVKNSSDSIRDYLT